MPNWIGDIVMATPLLRALRAHWPAARLLLAGPPHLAPLVEGLASFDEVLLLPPRRGLPSVREAARVLAGARAELALLLTGSLSSALAARLAGIGRRVGLGGRGRDWLLTDVLPPLRGGGRPVPLPAVSAYLRLLAPLGVPPAGFRTELATTPRDEARVEGWLARAGLAGVAPLFALHPGASFGPSKLWDLQRFAEVADGLHARHGGACVVLCGPTEHGPARAIAAAARSPVVAAADEPLDLGAVKALMRRVTLLVCTDSGPRHLAPPFDVPSVVLMGPTDPRLTNTNLGRSRVVRVEVPCGPCQLPHCPLDHACMTAITPSMALAAADLLLGVRR